MAFRSKSSLQGPDGKPVGTFRVEGQVGLPPKPGESTREIVTQVKNPLKWNAEKPHLYKLTLALKQNGDLIERIERNVGFRKIEVRGSQLPGQRRCRQAVPGRSTMRSIR